MSDPSETPAATRPTTLDELTRKNRCDWSPDGMIEKPDGPWIEVNRLPSIIAAAVHQAQTRAAASLSETPAPPSTTVCLGHPVPGKGHSLNEGALGRTGVRECYWCGKPESQWAASPPPSLTERTPATAPEETPKPCLLTLGCIFPREHLGMCSPRTENARLVDVLDSLAEMYEGKAEHNASLSIAAANGPYAGRSLHEAQRLTAADLRALASSLPSLLLAAKRRDSTRHDRKRIAQLEVHLLSLTQQIEQLKNVLYPAERISHHQIGWNDALDEVLSLLKEKMARNG